MKTLVVDDQQACRTLLQDLLGKMGHRVDCAENGRDAVLLYIHAAEQGEPYSFVCMDNQMPIMDGSSAVQQIRAWERDHLALEDRSMICFVTGDAICSCQSRAAKRGECLTCFLPKPLDIKQFLELVKKRAETDCCCKNECNLLECLKKTI